MASKQAKAILEIRDLHGGIEGEKILNGVNLEVCQGETHAIMGPNGSGKSTLSKIISGHPQYFIESGEILFQGEDISGLEPDERARMGIFLGFQYPIEIPGVSNIEFLRASTNARRSYKNQEELDIFEFEELVNNHLSIIQMNNSFLERSVNEGFSGGEKKRNEILQMSLLDPLLSILDETDSGLDIDSLTIVSNAINKLSTNKKGIVLITHYQRLLDKITPNYVHVMKGGKIVQTGGKELAIQLEKEGYKGMQSNNE